MSPLSLFIVISSVVGLTLAVPWIPESKADEEWWMVRHEEYVQNSNLNGGNVSVVFFGDSITQAWGAEGSATFEQYYVPLGASNYGIGSDRVENVLWRIVNGEVNGLSNADVCVLKIGTNNFWMNEDVDIARGIAAVTDALRSRQPNMKVLVLGILPRSDIEMTARVDNVNQMISVLDNGNSIRFFNMRDSFYLGNGVFDTDLYTSDLLHLSSAGYVKWAEVMDPIFREMLGQ